MTRPRHVVRRDDRGSISVRRVPRCAVAFERAADCRRPGPHPREPAPPRSSPPTPSSSTAGECSALCASATRQHARARMPDDVGDSLSQRERECRSCSVVRAPAIRHVGDEASRRRRRARYGRSRSPTPAALPDSCKPPVALQPVRFARSVQRHEFRRSARPGSRSRPSTRAPISARWSTACGRGGRADRARSARVRRSWPCAPRLHAP